MQHIAKRLTLLILLALGLTLSGATATWAGQPRLFLQEESSEAEQQSPSEDQAPPAAGDEAPPAPAPGPGPGSDQPWYNWRNDVSNGKQALGLIHYGEFWARREEALGHPSLEGELNLSGVMDGLVLQKEVNFVRMLETRGQAQIVRVQHQPSVVYADDDNYVIIDQYLDQTYMVNARTREAIDGGPPAEPKAVNMAYRLHFQNDDLFPDQKTWKVIDWQAVTFE